MEIDGEPHKLIKERKEKSAEELAKAVANGSKNMSASEALKLRERINSGAMQAPPANRPEDKPDSPEYKKRQAMLAGPVLELDKDNAGAAFFDMEESTFTALKDIFLLITKEERRTGVIAPERFLDIFKDQNDMFRTQQHQDAHEFLGLLLNAVMTNVEDNQKRINESTTKAIGNGNGMVQSMSSAISSAARAVGLSTGTHSPGAGWVHDIFEGLLTSETKCLTCETASQRDETFVDLSIDLEEHSSITSCLRKFSAEEMLCERNKFHCDNCGGLQEAEKRMKIKKLPRVLVLHLKRFKYSEDMMRLQKLFHRVVYPYYLRMFNTTDDAEDPDRVYELYAVVVHIGAGPWHGHYVSIIKTKDRGWLLFDDEMVEPVDKHYVRSFFGDKPGQACAYVLFYQETTVEAMQAEQEAEGLAEVALASQEAGIALGHPQPNGTYVNSISKQVSNPNTPTEDADYYASLNHAISAPLPASPSILRRSDNAPMATSPSVSALDGWKFDGKSKEERALEKKETKEADKARKLADKERIRADERRRKEVDSKRREFQKSQADDMKAVLAASKASAAEESERRRREPSNGNGAEKREPGGALSRYKSMSRKSISFFGAGKGERAEDTVLEGEASGVQTPERHEKPSRHRFSLGKKRSNLMSS